MLNIGANAVVVSGGFAGTGGRIDGSGSFTTNGAVTLSNLTLGGGLKWHNLGTATETGSVTVGDGSGQSATIINAAGATFNITADAGIALVVEEPQAGFGYRYCVPAR